MNYKIFEDGADIPKTFEEAVVILFEALNPAERDTFASVGVSGLHHGLGRTIRNGWHLWEQKSELTQHFIKVYGLGHADDMSSLILSAVIAKITNKPLNLDAEVAETHKFWEEQGIDAITMQKVAKKKPKKRRWFF